MEPSRLAEEKTTERVEIKRIFQSPLGLQDPLEWQKEGHRGLEHIQEHLGGGEAIKYGHRGVKAMELTQI